VLFAIMALSAGAGHWSKPIALLETRRPSAMATSDDIINMRRAIDEARIEEIIAWAAGGSRGLVGNPKKKGAEVRALLLR
jgi:hypothetical protein